MSIPSRRSPPAADRVRDPERTRRALLDAALAEFAAKGIEGARVSSIAERAGVNKQLISYYFGGKQGLHDAIAEEWAARERQIQAPDIGLDELTCRYLDVVKEQPDLHRLFLREHFDADVDEIEHDPDSPDMIEMNRRQQIGEIPDDIDPGFLLLVLQSAVSAGVVFPADVKRNLGLDPDSDEYFELADAQLRLIIRRLIAD